MVPSLSAAQEFRADAEPPIRQALALTVHTQERRAWWYSNLVDGIIALPLFCTLTAIVGWFWYPLWRLLAVLPNESRSDTGGIMQAATRRAVSRTCDVIQQCQLDRTAGITLAATCIG